jgi:hypothetical protein
MIVNGLVGEIGVEPAALARSGVEKRVIGEPATERRAAPHD